MILKKKLIVGLNIKGNPSPVYYNILCLRSVKVKLQLVLAVIKLENARELFKDRSGSILGVTLGSSFCFYLSRL